jgi:hypothetical protein
MQVGLESELVAVRNIPNTVFFVLETTLTEARW